MGRHKHKRHCMESRDKHCRKTSQSSSSSTNSDSEEWVEKQTQVKRDNWMSMTGMLKTYTKNDIKPDKDKKTKAQIDSYNPATSSRELNPYWKSGGTGLPQTSEQFRKSKPFIKPSDEENYYSRTSKTQDSYESVNSSRDLRKLEEQDQYYSISGPTRYMTDNKKSYDLGSRNNNNTKASNNSFNKSSNWRKGKNENEDLAMPIVDQANIKVSENSEEVGVCKAINNYLSDEKMNKLGAKIIKAEIMGDTKLVNELKSKLEAAREYRKQNPQATNIDDSVILMSTNSLGNSRPLTKNIGDPKSKGGKRKADTHVSGERSKYFGNDDKYNLSQMFQQEKYGTNYDDEAQLASVSAKHKNPNDDLEDIFVDEISKNENAAKQSEREKNRAINQHVKMERSLDGCEYCVDSKNMLKHLMVSCGNKVYLALPARKSLVRGQCIITTIQHNMCVTSLDEDVWEEILDYRKALTNFFDSQNKDVVFFETAMKLNRFPHLIINCVPLPRDVGDMAAIYFKKALLECEAEWSMNKKVIDLKGKNIRKGVPKGLPYFWIDFGMDPGFAHVIEDQQLFPRNFAEEIIGGFLDLNHNLWKNPSREYGDLQRKKVLDFVKDWKHFDSVAKDNKS